MRTVTLPTQCRVEVSFAANLQNLLLTAKTAFVPQEADRLKSNPSSATFHRVACETG